ncbi:MAG: intracellular protease, PfpI family [Bacteroidota bacterium]|nr:intracellular protease, PfpI family [Bacteroidota bacterium]
MKRDLSNKRVAIIATDGVEESEFTKPYQALKDADVSVDVISLKAGKIKAWNKKEWGNEYPVDKTIDSVKATDYDALVLPGGVMNPDKLRVNKEVVNFTKAFMDSGKTVAAICHGPWTLVETGKLAGRTMTSYPSIKTDLINAKANWVDQEVVVDKNLITSRKPDDLPAFCEKMLDAIGKA